MVLLESEPWKRRPHVTGGRLHELRVHPKESADRVDVPSDGVVKSRLVGVVSAHAVEGCDGEDGVQLTSRSAALSSSLASSMPHSFGSLALGDRKPFSCSALSLTEFSGLTLKSIAIRVEWEA